MNEDFTLRINESLLCPNVSLEPYEAKVIIMDDECEHLYIKLLTYMRTYVRK